MIYFSLLIDRVYDCEESTYDIYEETVKDIVLAGIDGFNGKCVDMLSFHYFFFYYF